MSFRLYKLKYAWKNLGARVAVIVTVWLLIISILHFQLNYETHDRPTITMGYMPVITNLASPLLDHASKKIDGIRFKALKFSSFAEMAESLRNGEIDAAFMIAPLAIQLRQQGEDVKVVYIGNRHESTFVARKELHVTGIHDLIGKTVAVPMRYSGHNLSMLKLVEDTGLEGQINIVEMNPPDMAAALATGSLDAYYVGEPFAATSVKNGYSDIVHYVEDVWDGFICNLVVVRQEMIEENPDTVKTLVSGAVRSGLWASNHTKEAALIAARYWNQSPDLVEYAMTTPENRIRYDRYLPEQEEMQYMADLMQHYGLIKDNDIGGLIEDRFAREANTENINDFESILSL